MLPGWFAVRKSETCDRSRCYDASQGHDGHKHDDESCQERSVVDKPSDDAGNFKSHTFCGVIS